MSRRTKEPSSTNEQLQHEIEERRRIASLLATENRILELIATSTDIADLFATLCDALEHLIPNSRCAIRLAHRNPQADARPSHTTETITEGLDAFGAIAREGIYPPLCSERTIIPFVRPGPDDPLRKHEIQSIWLEPIAGAGGAIVGTLGVYCTRAARLDDDVLAAGAMVTRLTAIVVERDRADERARQQLAQLAHVARLATMGEMASGLAHELNQPLCAIVNFAEACVELVQRNGHDREQLSAALGEVAKQAERAGEVIRRLREFVKRREPVRQPVDLNAVVREVIAFTSVETRQNEVRVRAKTAKVLPKVFADQIQIEQVLVNLVRNACEAMLECDPSARSLTIETLRHKGAVEVTVSDGGPGIPEEIQERLFDPFFSTKRDGMGMGLSISRSILEAHDGRLWVTSNRKCGSTFHFTLPTAWRAQHGRRHRVRGR